MDKKKLKERKPIDIWHFIVGNLRYRIYYTWFYFLIPKHIREQIDYRIKSMNPVCYSNGSCIECGCRTTELQMSNKRCDGNCYPRIMNRILWKNMKLGGAYFSKNGKYKWILKDDKFKYIELESQ